MHVKVTLAVRVGLSAVRRASGAGLGRAAMAFWLSLARKWQWINSVPCHERGTKPLLWPAGPRALTYPHPNTQQPNPLLQPPPPPPLPPPATRPLLASPPPRLVMPNFYFHPVAPDDRTYRLTCRANEYFERHHYKEAVIEYTKTIMAMGPSDGKDRQSNTDFSALIYSNRSASYCMLKQWSDAENDAVYVMKIRPAWAKVS